MTVVLNLVEINRKVVLLYFRQIVGKNLLSKGYVFHVVLFKPCVRVEVVGYLHKLDL